MRTVDTARTSACAMQYTNAREKSSEEPRRAQEASRGRFWAESSSGRAADKKKGWRARMEARGFGRKELPKNRRTRPPSLARALQLFAVSSYPNASTVADLRCAMVSGILNVG
jgi:hypothetical protein